MADTENYEHLLDRKNVLAVEYDEQSEEVVTLVSQKEPEDDLPDAELVDNQTEEDTDVIDLGMGEEREAFEPLVDVEIPEAQSDKQTRHRPIPGGVSEINANSTAATGGPYPAVVTDPDASSAKWDSGVDQGQFVRLSNNHVYARVNKADFDEDVIQPSPMDGGSVDDRVGSLAGYVPIDDGEYADAAARTVAPERETAVCHDLDLSPVGVYREDYSTLKSEPVVKTGRTTGVTEGKIVSTSASLKVNYGDAGTILLRDQLVTDAESAGGDSGSPMLLSDSGQLVGMLFAGGGGYSIINKITHVEEQLGVRILSGEPMFAGGYTTHQSQGVWAAEDSLVLPASIAPYVFTENRREILRVLASDDTTITSISDLADVTDRYDTHVSQDINLLQSWGIVKCDDEGRRRVPSLVEKRILVEPILAGSATSA